MAGFDSELQPALGSRPIRAIFKIKLLGLTTIGALFWLLELVSPFDRPVAITIVIAFPALLAVAIVSRDGPIPRWLLQLALAVDALALTVGIHFGGGVDNVSAPALYTIIIGMAGLLLAPGDTFRITAVIVILYDGLVLLEWAGLLPHQVSYSRPPHRQVSTVVALDLYLMLLAWIVSYAVTQVRHMYQQLEDQRREAVHGLAHDLKNPLSVVTGYTQLLRHAGDAERQTYIEAVEHAAAQALDLVTNIVDAAAVQHRPFRAQLAPLRIEDMIAEVTARHRLAAQRAGVAVIAEIDGAMPSVEMDRQLVSRAVGNLLSNAIKYGKRGGTVRLRVQELDGDAVIEVCDEGPGIPPDEQARLFEKYSRTSSAGDKEGSGLGLFIVRRIAEAHQGAVSVRSEPGQGAAFQLRLPLTCRGAPL
ncbi:MAG TPA: HAMP domain-containing sensor histidine kinase [Terriglobales bacterium]|nr:HAMP domain-containing sensor histidine kinase [Terriglobales bacterium]